MKKRFLLFALMLVLLPASAWAKDGKALMLTVFGTSTEASITFDELLPLVQKQFPDRDVVIPYTSGTIRNKLNAAINAPEKKILSPEQMLEKLKSEGYTDIAVISTILFPGVEHDKLQASVNTFAEANKNIRVSYTPPLLSDPQRLQPVVESIGKHIIKNGANVVVTHGTHHGHAVEALYQRIADMVAARYPNARVGSVEGVPDMDKTLDWLKTTKGKEARFIVFMFVAGDHAENDISGSEEDSYFSAARAMGKTPTLAWVESTAGKRIASLGLDPDYRKILLDYFIKNVR